MHELSVALGIVKIAEEEASKVHAGRVDTIELEIGSLAGIEMESFDFVWPMAVKDTVLENARRKVNRVEASAICLECGMTYPLNNVYDGCPECKSHFKDIVTGQELRVVALEVA